MRCRRGLGALVLVLVMAALGGCADALTAYSIAKDLDAVPDVPSVAGTWIFRDESGEPIVLEVEVSDDGLASCRSGAIRVREGDKTYAAGNEVCFVELNGYLVAELRDSSGPMPFYRQYLVRIDEENLEICGGFPVWALLYLLADDHAVGYSFESLQYAEVEHEKAKTWLIISKAPEMRTFLEIALPELASACDSGEEGGSHISMEWGRATRMTPEEQEQQQSQ